MRRFLLLFSFLSFLLTSCGDFGQKRASDSDDSDDPANCECSECECFEDGSCICTDCECPTVCCKEGCDGDDCAMGACECGDGCECSCKDEKPSGGEKPDRGGDGGCGGGSCTP